MTLAPAPADVGSMMGSSQPSVVNEAADLCCGVEGAAAGLVAVARGVKSMSVATGNWAAETSADIGGAVGNGAAKGVSLTGRAAAGFFTRIKTVIKN